MGNPVIGEELVEKEAIDALVALGFPRQKAKQVLSQISQDISSLEDKIKEALRIVKR